MIITILNTKGGSGKSTIAINLAVAYGLENKEVLLVDTDEQKSVTKFCNIRSSKLANLKNSKDFSSESNPYKANFTSISKDGESLGDSVVSMAEKYEIVLIDTKATKNDEQKMAMLISDYVIIPTTTSQIDLSELLNLFEYIREVKVVNRALKSFIVLNRINPNPLLYKEPQELKAFIDEYKSKKQLKDVYILDSILHDRVGYKRSISDGLGVCELLDNKCGVEFGEFYEEIKNKIQGV